METERSPAPEVQRFKSFRLRGKELRSHTTIHAKSRLSMELSLKLDREKARYGSIEEVS